MIRTNRCRIAALLGCMTMLTACASSTQSSTGTSTSASGLSSAQLAYLQAQLKKYEAIPTFVPPGPAFNAAAAKGKLIVDIPFSSSIPFLTGIDTAMEQVAKLAGIRWVEYANQGEPSQWIQGIDTAIAEHANLVILGGAPSPYQLQPQLKALKAHGIPVEVTHVLDPSQPVPPNVTAVVPANFYEVARLVADYAILQTEGHAQMLVITSNDILASPGQGQAVQQELASRCGSGCHAYLVNVPTQDWATDIQTTVESFLHSHPNVNCVYPLYDSESEFAAPAIVADGDAGKVFIATYNGTPAILKLMETGNVVKFEIGEDLTWLGWAQMDQAMRILTGHAPVKTENTPLRIFTDSTVDETGVPPAYNEGYGNNAFETGYLKLWGLK